MADSAEQEALCAKARGEHASLAALAAPAAVLGGLAGWLCYRIPLNTEYRPRLRGN